MTDRVLSDAEVEKMQTPLWEQAKAAIDAGDADGAKALIDRAVAQWAGLKDYSINWITRLLTFIADELGEEAVERALRKTGDEFVRPAPRHRAPTGVDLPAAQRAKVIARAMLGNMGEVEVDGGRREDRARRSGAAAGASSSTTAATRASTRTGRLRERGGPHVHRATSCRCTARTAR